MSKQPSKRAGRTPKPRLKLYRFNGFNIKLQSNTRKGEEAYAQIMDDAFEKSSNVPVGGDKAIALKTLFHRTVSYKGVKYPIQYGQMVRFTVLKGNNWYNTESREIVEFEVPKNQYPNGVECNYVFFPSGKFAPNVVGKFLESVMKSAVALDENIIVTLIQSRDAIDRILTASKLLRLEVKLSYSNADAGGPAKKFIDDLYKEAKAGTVETIIKPDHNSSLDASSTFVKGSVELAKENGEATAVVRRDENSRRNETIVTTEHPEKRTVETTDEENIYDELFDQIMNDRANESTE